MNVFYKLYYSLIPQPKTKHFYKKIHYLTHFKPKNISFYIEAFTHTANSKDNKDLSFERLEFLGDAILSSIVTEYIFIKRPNEDEGALTQLRSKIVSRKNLNKVGKELSLSHFLVNFDNQNLEKNIHGNLLESLIGAIYLDLGYVKCKIFINKNILNNLCLESLENKITSYKSFLHEWCQKYKTKLEYVTVKEENAEDITVFSSIIKLDGELFVKGRATNKKLAEENASKRAYYSLQTQISKNEDGAHA